MNFGIHLIQQNIGIDECRRLWRWADTAGFDWFDVSDHFYESPMTEKQGPYLECLACLTALAVDTEHMRVGTMALAMDYRRPAAPPPSPTPWLPSITSLTDALKSASAPAGTSRNTPPTAFPSSRSAGGSTCSKRASR